MFLPPDNPVAIARASYQACLEKDRAALEELLADDFRFRGADGKGVGRKAYVARRCPRGEGPLRFDFIHFARDGDRVLVAYQGRTASGARFRTMEVVSVREGRIVGVEACPPGSERRRASRDRRGKRRPAPSPAPGSSAG
jgi:ketosteroid isomerase-like protein